MTNKDIAKVFSQIADILDILGENVFRVNAYRNASLKISSLGFSLRDVYLKDPKKLEDIKGIGKDLRAKIIEMLNTGKCEFHQKLLKNFPPGVLDMLNVRGLGPKKIKLFWSELGIDSIAKLRDAAEKGLLRSLPKMGEKSEKDILIALNEYDLHTSRMLISDALEIANAVIVYLKGFGGIKRIEYAGSLRRRKESVGDIDILVSLKDKDDSASVMDFFGRFPDVKTVIAKGDTKSSVILNSGIQIDLRVIDDDVFGAAFHYFTGSKEHNIVVREIAKRKGLKVNEYGVFDVKTGEKIAGKSEKEVFKSVGLPFIMPTLRENRGEIEAGRKGKLPDVVELSDLKGDLHVHSLWSDGSQKIIDIAKSYKKRGFSYIALTDHSQAMHIANGLSPERFFEQFKEIDAVNKELSGFRVFRGVECDILADGKMDLPDEVLAQMEIVVASVHNRFGLNRVEQTNRIIKAISNPYVKILGHPTGRLINRREPFDFDFSEVVDACKAFNVVLEINSQPSRLDLNDAHVFSARENGNFFSIDSDSHDVSQIDFLQFGVWMGQRGWLSKDMVVNAKSLNDVIKFFKI